MAAEEQGERVDGGSQGRVPDRLTAVIRELARVPLESSRSAWEGVLAPGAVVGRFELVREVGRGGSGIVYEARDRQLGRTVAFKAVWRGDRLDEREELLLQEAESAARLSHPNVVTLFDVGRSEHGPYLILEFLRGEPLSRRLDSGPVPTLEAVRIAREVASGIAHAHAHGIVHRDLTPGNVFLCDDGRVKVLDLGMARAFGRRTVEGGTPGYMAPEQRRGAPEDERTDVFALGAILYRMLTDELPFPERGAQPRGAAGLDVPAAPELGDLVSRMLDADPVKRPRDAGAVLDALTRLSQTLEEAPADALAAIARPRRRRRLRRPALVAAAVLALLAAAAGVALQRSARAPAPAAAPSIAVLPFADVSPQKDQEYFADGLADEILNALARVDGLRVAARTSSFSFKGKDATLSDIARELRVGTVLEGSVRMAGSRVRVTAQLVNAVDGYRVWSQVYDREVTDIFAVQEDIARAVAGMLDVRLRPGTADVAGRPTTRPDAYTQYLVGRQQFHRMTVEGVRRAVAAYEKAVALDPGYAPAWAGLAVPLYYLSDEADTPADVRDRRRRAYAAAQKAVELAPDLPLALSSRGILRGLMEHDWAGARADFQRALAVSPNDADTHRRYGALLLELGEIREAIAEVRKSVDLDPLGVSWGTLGTLLQASGDLEAADAAFRRLIQISPGVVPGMVGLGRNLLLQSRPTEALAALQSCPESVRLWGEAIARHTLRDEAASSAALSALESAHAHTSALAIAEVHAWRGDKERAFEWLERAVAEPGGTAGGIRSDPFLKPLHGDPRFAALLRAMNLPPD